MVTTYPNIHKIFLMGIKYINIFQFEALKIFPNWDFWFEKKPSGNPGVHVSAYIGNSHRMLL
jgi:hypothetical protein